MSTGFTKYAEKHNFVVEMPKDTGTFYWDAPKDGRYIACGIDADGKRFRMTYQTGYMNITQIWTDFCGRWGLNNLWWENPADNSRHLIWRKW